MTEQIRLRIDSDLAREAGEVCRELGITPTAAVSMPFAQMVKMRGLPFRPSDPCSPHGTDQKVGGEAASRGSKEGIAGSG